MTFIYDLRLRKGWEESTGNSVRGTTEAKPSIAPVNTDIERGEEEFDGLLETMEKGYL